MAASGKLLFSAQTTAQAEEFCEVVLRQVQEDYRPVQAANNDTRWVWPIMDQTCNDTNTLFTSSDALNDYAVNQANNHQMTGMAWAGVVLNSNWSSTTKDWEYTLR